MGGDGRADGTDGKGRHGTEGDGRNGRKPDRVGCYNFVFPPPSVRGAVRPAREKIPDDAIDAMFELEC